MVVDFYDLEMMSDSFYNPICARKTIETHPCGFCMSRVGFG